MDAIPLLNADLDADAEEFILAWAMEFRSDARLQIHIHVEQFPSDDDQVQDVGPPCTELYELEGDDHGQMAQPAHPLLVRFIKSIKKSE